MPTDDEIRELCAQVVSASGVEFETAIRELQSAIRHRLEDLSNQAIATLLKMPRVSTAIERQAKAKTAAAGGDEAGDAEEDVDKVS
jgi:hypothetical protein